MHRITCFFILLLIANTSQADRIFWGISAISQEVTETINNGTTTTTTTDDATGFGIYADIFYQNKYRLNGTISYVDYTSFSLASATASADYLIPVNPQATFFLGASAGGISQTYSSAGLTDSAFSGIYGLQAGAIMLITNNIMIEAGYRLRYTDLETEFSGTSITSTIDELNETYISLILFM